MPSELGRLEVQECEDYKSSAQRFPACRLPGLCLWKPLQKLIVLPCKSSCLLAQASSLCLSLIARSGLLQSLLSLSLSLSLSAAHSPTRLLLLFAYVALTLPSLLAFLFLLSSLSPASCQPLLPNGHCKLLRYCTLLLRCPGSGARAHAARCNVRLKGRFCQIAAPTALHSFSFRCLH